jgi:hypothetical protein
MIAKNLDSKKILVISMGWKKKIGAAGIEPTPGSVPSFLAIQR